MFVVVVVIIQWLLLYNPDSWLGVKNTINLPTTLAANFTTICFRGYKLFTICVWLLSAWIMANSGPWRAENGPTSAQVRPGGGVHEQGGELRPAHAAGASGVPSVGVAGPV